MKRAVYSILSLTTEIITIQDNCGVVSVTNDAEAVVSEVVSRHGNKRIHYYDSMGNLDELLHKNGEFVGFAVVQTEGRATK